MIVLNVCLDVHVIFSLSDPYCHLCMQVRKINSIDEYVDIGENHAGEPTLVYFGEFYYEEYNNCSFMVKVRIFIQPQCDMGCI